MPHTSSHANSINPSISSHTPSASNDAIRPPYSARIQHLQESATIAIATLASTLKAQGKDILSFSAGEPDFDTPSVIKDAAICALNEGFTKYTPVAGIPMLKQAIATKLQRENNLSYTPSQILISNGAKQSLFNIMQALIDIGDEVIIPAPYWVTYPELVTYSGGTNIFLHTDETSHFKITPSMLASAITPRTKALVLTTPSNPTGMAYTKQELESLARVLEGSNIYVLADEIYEKLLYEGEFISVGAINSDMFARTITINGLSKSVAMTGWRVGYCASADTKLITLMTNLQSQCTSNINSIAQQASITALEGKADSQIEEMHKAFLARRNLAVSAINNIPHLHCLSPQGAFYVFIRIGEACGGDSMLFCQRLLEQEGVALVPGVAFGAEGYVRFSFACSEEDITQGCARIARFMQHLA